METRLQKIAGLAAEMGVDAILLTGEVNMHYATKFPRLEGMVVIGRDGSGACFTDSRYIEAVTAAITPLGYRAEEPAGSYPTIKTISAYVAEKGIRTLGFENKAMSVAEYEAYRGELAAELVPIGDGMERLRRKKEPEEIASIEKAQRIAEGALARLVPELVPGAYEDELTAKLRYYMALGGSEDFAPGMILVCGKATSMPHGQPSHKALSNGDFVTIDFGAMANGYNSDMTRTFGIGHVSQKMKEVYAVVLEAQLAGIDAFERGKTGAEVDAAARDIIEKAGYGKYFGHGLGHSLGLEIHENPRASRTYSGRFETNDIITIEPGIYIPGEFGVRIEDMIYLSQEGKVNLTAFPKELMVV